MNNPSLTTRLESFGRCHPLPGKAFLDRLQVDFMGACGLSCSILEFPACPELISAPGHMGIEVALDSPPFRNMISGALGDVITFLQVLQEGSRGAHAQAPGTCAASEAWGFRVGLHDPVYAQSNTKYYL